ncbi:MAG: VOC family protein [Leptothrix sp. (in: b-proteobacteria)]
MDAMKTHGAFSWTELMTAQPQAAADFYHKLFDWTVQAMPMPNGDYLVIKVGDTPMGGIMAMPTAATGMAPTWGCYVTVDNTDETAGECEALGGRVLVKPTDIPGVGRFAVLQDPQGATLNIMAYNGD